MTRFRFLIALMVVFALILTGVPLIVGYWGRAAAVKALRAGCGRSSLRNIAYVNSTRADETANRIISTDPTQSERTRTARSREATAEGDAINVTSAQIDQAMWTLLNNPEDQHVVRYGSFGASPFRCETAYPQAEVIP